MSAPAIWNDEEAECPQDEQNDGDRQKHGAFLLVWFGPVTVEPQRRSAER